MSRKVRFPLFVSLSIIAMIGAFQNCSPAATEFQQLSVTDAGNGIMTAAGEVNFVNIFAEPLGKGTLADEGGGNYRFTIVNPNTARKATIRINPTSGDIRFQNLHMCLDENRPDCEMVTVPAGYAISGTQQINCSSPIFYMGALEGVSTTDMKPSCSEAYWFTTDDDLRARAANHLYQRFAPPR